MNISEDNHDRLTQASAIQVGGAPADSKATLCIYADALDPDFVSETVARRPTSARRKGERDARRPSIPPATVGQWFLEAPDPLPFVEKIQFLLDATTDLEGNWRTLAESHRLELRTAIFLRSWTEGFELSSDVLAEIARRHWHFSLSMYSADGDEIVESFLGPAIPRDPTRH
ncbi:MAG: DUF4279 domain-containing protein [Candidatus Hydrogenedentes bacterium]|nr:DUF4279 domain-containing protein [Candidatus Hydrogenedentota bacterium]